MEVIAVKRTVSALVMTLLCVLLLSSAAFAEEPQATAIELPPISEYSVDESEGMIALQADTQAAEEYIHDALLAGLPMIDVTRFGLVVDPERGINEVSPICYRLSKECPDLFHVDFTVGWNIYANGTTATEIWVQYTMGGSALKEAQAFYKSEVKRILDPMDGNWSDLEKLLYINDYVATHYEYLDTAPHHDAYNFFASGGGACQGYYMATRALLDAAGFHTTYGRVERSNSAGNRAFSHIWNVVELDGKWYHMDPTWNDPLGNYRGSAWHKYFLVSTQTMLQRDIEMEQKFDHTGKQLRGVDVGGASEGMELGLNITCNSTLYDNAPWKDVRSPYAHLNGMWYYADQKGWNTEGIYRTANVTRAGTQTLSVQRWADFANPGNEWYDPFCGLAAYKDWLIYNTSEAVNGYNPVTGELRTFFTVRDAYRDIYFMEVEGDQVYCEVDAHPSWNCQRSLCPTREQKSFTLTQFDHIRQEFCNGVSVREENGKVTIQGAPYTEEDFNILAVVYNGGKQKDMKMINSKNLTAAKTQWQLEGAEVKLFYLSDKFAPLS